MSSSAGPIVPREHGSWALLYGPFLVTVAALGTVGLPGLLFLTAITGLFLAREPLSRLVRTRSHDIARRTRSRWLRWLGAYLGATVASAGLLLALYDRWLLLPLGAAAALALALHIVLTEFRLDRTAGAQLLGVSALTASAPATYYVIEGRMDVTALILWVVNAMYFSSGVFHVKLLVSRHIRGGSSRLRAAQSLTFHLLLLVGIAVLAWRESLPLLVALAFIPVLARAFWGLLSTPSRLNLRRIGYTEVAYTVIFVTLAGAGLTRLVIG